MRPESFMSRVRKLRFREGTCTNRTGQASESPPCPRSGAKDVSGHPDATGLCPRGPLMGPNARPKTAGPKLRQPIICDGRSAPQTTYLGSLASRHRARAERSSAENQITHRQTRDLRSGRVLIRPEHSSLAAENQLRFPGHHHGHGFQKVFRAEWERDPRPPCLSGHRPPQQLSQATAAPRSPPLLSLHSLCHRPFSRTPSPVCGGARFLLSLPPAWRRHHSGAATTGKEPGPLQQHWETDGKQLLPGSSGSSGSKEQARTPSAWG